MLIYNIEYLNIVAIKNIILYLKTEIIFVVK